MKYFWIIILVLISTLCNAQEPIIKLDREPELFTVDKFGNIYVYQHPILKKYTSQGKLLAQYSNLESGKLHSIDVSDPFRVLLFYMDFNQILFLDNKLNSAGNPISLNDLGYYSVLAVCKSKQMAIWLYDGYQNKLIQYSFNPKGSTNTINLSKISNEPISINFMMEYGSELYVSGDNGSIWMFDQYGEKANNLKINVKYNFQIEGNTLIYNNGKNIFYYSLSNHEISSQKFDFLNEFSDLKISKDNIFILKKNLIYLQQKNWK